MVGVGAGWDHRHVVAVAVAVRVMVLGALVLALVAVVVRMLVLVLVLVLGARFSGIWSVHLCGLVIASFVFHIYRAPDFIGGSLSPPFLSLSFVFSVQYTHACPRSVFPFDCLSDLTSQ